ncbi:MAG: NB-ARC domain-containing protein [Thermosynechococcaceae cyanobacterium]
MNFEAVTDNVNQSVLAHVGRSLKPVERIVLQGAWQAKTYEQMAEECEYSLAYIKQVTGPRLWKLLSQVYSQKISKTNVRVLLERHYAGMEEPPVAVAPDPVNANDGFDISLEPSDRTQSLWGNAPEISVFHGREQELATLKQWLVADQCRLVALTGGAGIGKTALSVRCGHLLQEQFDVVIWRSLHQSPAVSNFVDDLLESITQKPVTPGQSFDSQLSRLMAALRQQRCLIILDAGSSILLEGHLAGQYRDGYEDYGQLLQRIGQVRHRSAVLFVNQEKPSEFDRWEGETLPVRSLRLKGLKSDAEALLKERNLLHPEKWDDLIRLYRGNPLALKIVATMIKNLFGGDVSAFLGQQTMVFGDLNDILDEQFERLSALEQELLYWLAIECQPISLEKLQADLLSPISTGELFEALGSLLRRELIDRSTDAGEILFSIEQPVVVHYVLGRLTEQIYAEIKSVSQSVKIETLELLRSHVIGFEDDPIQAEQQQRLIQKPIQDKLYRLFRDESVMETQIVTILAFLEDKPSLAVGYARNNLQILLGATLTFEARTHLRRSVERGLQSQISDELS